MAYPLDDIRVLDLTLARAGPVCVRQLSDWGADVIRVEAPVGEDAFVGVDPERGLGSDIQNLHRNKKSVTLDLKSSEGRNIFRELVASVDVLVENMRPGVKHRLGFSYDEVRAINPRIIYGSISAFGQDGPYGERGGVDQIAQGISGIMSVTGAPGGGPMRVGVAICDVTTGLYMAIGILTALHERTRTGEGQWVNTSLLEATIGMLDFQAVRWTVDGEVPRQEGNHHPTSVPMGCFPTTDGYVNIAAAGGRHWPKLCVLLDLEDLLDDERFVDRRARSRNREALNEIVAQVLSKRATAEWVNLLNDAGVPAGPVYSIDEVFADPQVVHLEMTQNTGDPKSGPAGLIRNPVRMSRSAPRPGGMSPTRGENTNEVLTQMGLSSADIEDLRRMRVV